MVVVIRGQPVREGRPSRPDAGRENGDCGALASADVVDFFLDPRGSAGGSSAGRRPSVCAGRDGGLTPEPSDSGCDRVKARWPRPTIVISRADGFGALSDPEEGTSGARRGSMWTVVGSELEVARLEPHFGEGWREPVGSSGRPGSR